MLGRSEGVLFHLGSGSLEREAGRPGIMGGWREAWVLVLVLGLGLAWACSGQAGLEPLVPRCLGGARGFVAPGEEVAGAGGREARDSIHA